ncbi:MAG: ParB N-terminal domain-containing protein [Planctomycetaceae bacterium]|nr:ParB N-terminal domain-containing protein [Planctomycetaceae bacterium]
MNIKQVSINELKPAPYNPRVSLKPGMPAYERLARSLDEFELVQPIVWNDQTGHVVSGHQRLQILKDRGVSEVDVVVVSLSLEREKALNVTLNNSQVGGDWDPGKLVDLIAELNALPDFDATLTGFDAEDLRDLVLAPDPAFVPSEEEDVCPMVKAILEIPPEQWDDVRPDLDHLISQHALRVHIQEPASRE